MGYWLKSFEDGEIIQGTDKDIDAKVVSWSQGRLDGMNGVDIHHNDICLGLVGKGKYWQSDTIEVIFPFELNHIIKRRIEKQINSDDTWFSVYRKENNMIISFGTISDTIRYTSPDIITFCQKENVGKWLVLEMDVRTCELKYYISDNKV
jgi:hypothetical protein